MGPYLHSANLLSETQIHPDSSLSTSLTLELQLYFNMTMNESYSEATDNEQPSGHNRYSKHKLKILQKNRYHQMRIESVVTSKRKREREREKRILHWL